VFAVSNGFTSISLLLFSFISGNSSIIIILFVIFFSCGLAGLLPTRTPIIREYFGTKHFGTILGITSIFLTIGTVLSPPIAGWIYDLRGVYDPYWLILSGVALVAAVSTLTMPLPHPNNKPNS
jgi:MFS family permease